MYAIVRGKSARSGWRASSTRSNKPAGTCAAECTPKRIIELRRPPAFVVCAQAGEHAALAGGPQGMAHFAAVADEVEVGGVVGVGREQALKIGMAVVGRELVGPQAQPAGDAM